jgi:acetyl-CoA decarbonylase/synthase complex subunit beta
MSDNVHTIESPSHTHGAGIQLEPEAQAILVHGLAQLIELTDGLAFRTPSSSRYALPLMRAVYGEMSAAARSHLPDTVRARVSARMESDPVSVLEDALVLYELYESNQPQAESFLVDDDAFLGQTFATKRSNGWIAILGDADRDEIEAAINAHWQFKFIAGPEGRPGIYPFLNLMARYGFVYGKIPFGEAHALGHFIEDFAPGVLLCRGALDDLEWTLSLATMKLGIPAVVPLDYPFSLGRQVRVEHLDELVESLVLFPNIHRLLDLPDIPRLPDYVRPEHAQEQFQVASTWGDTDESFYILRKGPVEAPGVEVIGEPGGPLGAPRTPLGVLLTAEAEPLDAFDRQYIEMRAARALSMVRGASARRSEGRLIVDMAAETELTPERIGEALIAAVRHEFPKIDKVYAQVIFDRRRLDEIAPRVRDEQAARRDEIASVREEDMAEFVTCVGCSPFAPDHVCILTPERPPQCNRVFAQAKTGALYSYDDMSNIHHRVLHSGINSFGLCDRGEAIDPVAGEWTGVNEAASRLTGGRTTRIQLHSLDTAPHTGCSCFRLIMFQTDVPRPGIGIMHRGYKGRAPDGRTWSDLHYALTGKQTPGMAGGSPAYLTSPKFLAAHDGWQSVVWVSPKIAALMGERLPPDVDVGREVP